MDAVEAAEAVKELKRFGFDEFCDGGGILLDMEHEIPSYLAKVRLTGNDFWNNVKGSAEYDKSSHRRR